MGAFARPQLRFRKSQCYASFLYCGNCKQAPTDPGAETVQGLQPPPDLAAGEGVSFPGAGLAEAVQGHSTGWETLFTAPSRCPGPTLNSCACPGNSSLLL